MKCKVRLATDPFPPSPGTSQERAFASITEMGPAILNGGITTSLALVFLSVSESYPYLVFFKVCTEVSRYVKKTEL